MFNLPKTFFIDIAELERQYIVLQSQYHPDKFVNKSPEEIAQATVKSSLINEQYQTLKDPVKRAKTLLPTQTEITTDPELLIEMMELREEIAHSRHCDELSDEAIHASDRHLPGLLRFARNDGIWGIAEKVNMQIIEVENSFEEALQRDDVAKMNELFVRMQYLYKAKTEIRDKVYKC